jgi:hypothetical protein
MKKDSLMVVFLDDAAYGGGPGVVVEITSDDVKDIMNRYADRDGCLPSRFRLWRSDPDARVGDKVSL